MTEGKFCTICHESAEDCDDPTKHGPHWELTDYCRNCGRDVPESKLSFGENCDDCEDAFGEEE